MQTDKVGIVFAGSFADGNLEYMSAYRLVYILMMLKNIRAVSCCLLVNHSLFLCETNPKTSPVVQTA